MRPRQLQQAQHELWQWYQTFKRPLPWRANRDPYRIWISETMLQQTTTAAVIPFFERFIQRFPDLKTLAQASEAQVLEAWSGLGYYSRARNLHRAAKELAVRPTFPETAEELLNYPGFGPYTSRAVASLAFSQPVGVVDGNVIRVLSRVEGQDWLWWKSAVRQKIQARADQWVQNFSSADMNQALMELGRTVCTPKSPTCRLCPLLTFCESHRQDKIENRPAMKPRRQMELWSWKPEIVVRHHKILIEQNPDQPFLRGQWQLPAQTRRLKTKPEKFDYRHSITHHDIFVTVPTTISKVKNVKSAKKWVPIEEIRQHVPASLVQKALSLFADRTGLLPTQRKKGRSTN